MAREFSLGLMVDATKENIYMTKSMDSEYTHGRMAVNTQVNGKTVSSMDKAFTKT